MYRERCLFSVLNNTLSLRFLGFVNEGSCLCCLCAVVEERNVLNKIYIIKAHVIKNGPPFSRVRSHSPSLCYLVFSVFRGQKQIIHVGLCQVHTGPFHTKLLHPFIRITDTSLPLFPSGFFSLPYAVAVFFFFVRLARFGLWFDFEFFFFLLLFPRWFWFAICGGGIAYLSNRATDKLKYMRIQLKWRNHLFHKKPLKVAVLLRCHVRHGVVWCSEFFLVLFGLLCNVVHWLDCKVFGTISWLYLLCLLFFLLLGFFFQIFHSLADCLLCIF